MKNFTYFRPATVDQAVSLLENTYGNTELLAGGTDLHDLQKEYVAQPTRIVSVNGINGFSGVQPEQGNPPRSVTIGAGTTLSDIAANAVIRQHFPALAAAAGQIAGPQIRNMATLGGNLCQRNRCWYFRDEHVNCLLKGGNTCFALNGENRYHAIFVQGHPCVIVNPSTIAPVLLALGATATVQGPNGRRVIDMARFYRAPSQNGQREHNLAANEIVVSVTIPNTGLANGHYEVRNKLSSDWPLVQAAVAFTNTNGRATNVKVVLGHVAPTPHEAAAAARALDNQQVNEQTATAAGRAAGEGSRPLSQNAYKVRLAEVAVKRVILIAAGQRRYWEV
jgi:xanthine dehydrogenase YagS FAD-binding subunit